MKKMVKDTGVLTAITLIAGILLAFVYEITLEPIASAQEQTKQNAYRLVFEAASEFRLIEDLNLEEAADILEQGGYSSNTIDEVAEALNEAGECLGYIVTVTSHSGYGGDIQFSIGIQNDGTVNAIEMLTISETAGLGMKAADSEFKGQFADKNVTAFAYTKNGASSDDEIDALSGATITTSAVTDGVNAGICYFQNGLEGGTASE